LNARNHIAAQIKMVDLFSFALVHLRSMAYNCLFFYSHFSPAWIWINLGFTSSLFTERIWANSSQISLPFCLCNSFFKLSVQPALWWNHKTRDLSKSQMNQLKNTETLRVSLSLFMFWYLYSLCLRQVGCVSKCI